MGHARALLGVENLNDQEALAIEIEEQVSIGPASRTPVRKLKDKNKKRKTARKRC